MSKIFKFGGASVKDAAAVRNVAAILANYNSEPIVVVVSAMGKITNALEEVVNAYMRNEGDAHEKLGLVKNAHYQILRDLFGTENHEVYHSLNDRFVEIEWILEETPEETYDYIYDQIVSIGEFLSTQIVSAYLNEIGIKNTWLDVRDVIRTDNTYRDGNVDWSDTETRIRRTLPELLTKGLVVTQGFIGGTSENFTTTLGREGSDYTAAIFSYCLHAETMTVWKDVPGILTADPRLFNNVSKIDRLSYREAIEMTYYGAQVIHPKTIKPLQNKNIPLHVRSFLQPEAVGTIIDDTATTTDYPPMIVVKANQVLLHIATRDFSFVAEEHLSAIFALLATHRLSANMMLNTAISFSVCVNNIPERLAALQNELNSRFNIKLESDLELITIRHYNQSTLHSVQIGKTTLLQETLSNTAQLVVKNTPVMAWKN